MFRVLAAAAILTTSSVSAFAANFDWAGPYAGGHFGLGAQTSQATFGSIGTISPPFSKVTVPIAGFGPFGGFQAGIQGQSGNAVFGAEIDGSLAGISGSGVTGPLQQPPVPPHAGSTFTATQSINWLATARLRAGYANDVAFFYVTGGLIAGGVKNTSVVSIPSVAPGYVAASSSTKTKYGWTLGGGTELVVGEKWTMKLEALYFDLGTDSQTSTFVPAKPAPSFFGGATKFSNTGILFRTGLNRHF